jgi:hypothetical protein
MTAAAAAECRPPMLAAPTPSAATLASDVIERPDRLRRTEDSDMETSRAIVGGTRGASANRACRRRHDARQTSATRSVAVVAPPPRDADNLRPPSGRCNRKPPTTRFCRLQRRESPDRARRPTFFRGGVGVRAPDREAARREATGGRARPRQGTRRRYHVGIHDSTGTKPVRSIRRNSSGGTSRALPSE